VNVVVGVVMGGVILSVLVVVNCLFSGGKVGGDGATNKYLTYAGIDFTICGAIAPIMPPIPKHTRCDNTLDIDELAFVVSPNFLT
jgi:hypothetical protein